MRTDRRDEYEAWREQFVRRKSETDDGPPRCSVCGEAVAWTGRGFMHVLPAFRKPAGSYPSDAWTLEQIAWGTRLGEWTLKTSSHAAEVRG